MLEYSCPTPQTTRHFALSAAIPAKHCTRLPAAWRHEQTIAGPDFVLSASSRLRHSSAENCPKSRVPVWPLSAKSDTHRTAEYRQRYGEHVSLLGPYAIQNDWVSELELYKNTCLCFSTQKLYAIYAFNSVQSNSKRFLCTYVHFNVGTCCSSTDI